MKKLVMLWALLWALMGSSACAEAPLMVDRINSPGEYADFAFSEDAQLLEIAFPQMFDVDAAVLRFGDEVVLIDCASEKMADRVLVLLDLMGVTEIDAVINTHPHHDHILGLGMIADKVKIRELRLGFPDNETEHMAKVLDICARHGIQITRYGDGDRWQLGDAVLDVWLKGDDTWTLNNRSAVIRLQYGQRNMLFAADAEYQLQKRLTEVIAPELLDIEVIKYPHHGIAVLGDSFFKATTPLFAVITNNGSERNKDARYMLGIKHVPLAFTVPGHVYLRTDGTTWLMERLAKDEPIP